MARKLSFSCCCFLFVFKKQTLQKSYCQFSAAKYVLESFASELRHPPFLWHWIIQSYEDQPEKSFTVLNTRASVGFYNLTEGCYNLRKTFC